MTTRSNGDPRLHAVGERIERLLAELHEDEDARSAVRAEELVRLVTELYGAGLEHVVALVCAEAPMLLERLVADELIAGLLIVHDLHPHDLTTRVERALEAVRPLLGAHGGNVELVDITPEEPTVRLRLLGSCDGCPSSAITLRHAVDGAIRDAAPEVVRIDVEEPTPEHVVAVQLGTKPRYEACPTEVPAR